MILDIFSTTIVWVLLLSIPISFVVVFGFTLLYMRDKQSLNNLPILRRLKGGEQYPAEWLTFVKDLRRAEAERMSHDVIVDVQLDKDCIVYTLTDGDKALILTTAYTDTPKFNRLLAKKGVRLW